MVCILSVFIPAFIMAEPVRSLFVPLSLAVGFAMISSYFLSSTVVPVLAIRLLKHRGSEQKGDKPKKKGGFDWFRDNVYTKVLQAGVNLVVLDVVESDDLARRLARRPVELPLRAFAEVQPRAPHFVAHPLGGRRVDVQEGH